MRRDQNAAYYTGALKTAEKKTPPDHDLIEKLNCSLRKCELVQALASQLFDTKEIVFGDGKMLTPTHVTVQKAMKQGCKQLWTKLKIPLPNALNFLYKYFVRHFGAKKYNGKFASRLEALKKREPEEGGVDKKKPKKEPASGGKRKHQEAAGNVSTKLKATKKRKQKATKKTVSKPISTVTHV